MSDEAWKALGIIIPSLVSFLGLLVSWRNNRKIKTLNTAVDGVLTAHVTQAEKSGKKTGIIQEKNDQRDRDESKEKRNE